MRIEYYSTRDEAKILIDAALSLGESVIHDDFIDIDDKPTDGTSGRLTFDIKPDPIPDPDEELLKILKNKLEAGTFDSRVELDDLLKLITRKVT